MRRARLVCLVYVLLLVIGAVSDARAEVVSNVAPPFKITIPDGFVARPDQVKADQIVAFHRAGFSAGDVGTIVAVDRMHGTIGREKPSLADVAKLGGDATAAIEPARWKGFEVWQVRMTQSLAGKDLVFFLVQVPLKPEAIQVKVAVDAKNEPDGRAIMAQVLASVEGETNWLNDRERSRKLGEGVGRLAIVAIILLIIVVFAVRKLRS